VFSNVPVLYLKTLINNCAGGRYILLCVFICAADYVIRHLFLYIYIYIYIYIYFWVFW
jgi:hypothetical protein